MVNAGRSSRQANSFTLAIQIIVVQTEGLNLNYTVGRPNICVDFQGYSVNITKKYIRFSEILVLIFSPLVRRF